MLPESKRISNSSATVGEIKSSASVSPTGAANVEVPLVFPSGINGMEPKLSVAYSSQSGIGMLGMGADLSGLSVISITGKNQLIDGKNEVPKFQSDGALTMDGQRLIRTGDGIYQTYLYSLTRIEAAGTIGGGPAYFKVTSPQGLVAEYGTTEDSRVYTEDRNNILSWRVSKVTDLNGNTIRYKYTEDRNKGSYIREIIYGEEADIHVTFDYTDKEIPASSFVDGSFFHANLLLAGINISCSGQSTFRKYSFSYSGCHLSKITEHGTNGEKLALDYEWGNYNENATWETILNVEKKDNSRFVAGDVNGDGEIDLVRYYRYKEKDFIQVFIQENNKFVSKFSQKLTDITTLDNSDSSYQLYNVLDVNNDGRDEIVIIHTVPFNSSITSWEFFIYSYQNSLLSLKTNNLPIANLNNEKEDNIIVANINNDNIPDWIHVRKDGYCRYATNYFQNSSVIKLQDVISEDLDIDKSFAIDYNGDGISELLIRNKGKWYLSPFLNKSSKAIQLLDDSNQSSANKYENVYIADLNNNGLQDIIFIANNLLLKTYYNKGDGTFDIIDSNAIYQKLIDNNEWANFATQKYLKLTTLDLHASDYNNDLINEISIYAQFDDKGKKMSAFVELKDINHIGYSVTHFNVISGESYNLYLLILIMTGKKKSLK